MKKLIMLSLAITAIAAWSARAEDAKTIFEKDCAKCHGVDGKGQTKMGQKLGCKDYSDAKVQADLKDDAATKAIKEGLKDKEGKTLMKAAEGLSDEEVKGLVAYMKSLKK
jgi:cytochrome c553